MKQQKEDSKLIFALSILWGLLLISLQFFYFMGRADGIGDALDLMYPYIPIAVSILIPCGVAGRELAKVQININLTKRHFIAINYYNSSIKLNSNYNSMFVIFPNWIILLV